MRKMTMEADAVPAWGELRITVASVRELLLPPRARGPV